MGQKVRPESLRLGINKNWGSIWYAEKGYASQLHEDLAIRKYLKKAFYQAGVSEIVIERFAAKMIINIHVAKPGIVIGRRGADIEKHKAYLAKLTSSEVHINIIEVKVPERDATLVAENIAYQLEKRKSFRKAMKRAISDALRHGAQGIKIDCSGRLSGAEIARTESYREGRVPLHTLRAVIDYGFAEANTTYGVIGVKVWIYKGDSVAN